MSGSGASYTVSVSGMTQAGTVTASIPAGKATSVAGLTNDASTSSDNTVTYAPIAISTTTLPNPVYNQTYSSQTVAATGGSGALTFSRTAGALPAGMFLSSGGVLSGKPTASGPFNFTITATDAEGSTASQAYSVTIAAPTIAIDPVSLSNGTFGTAYSQTLAASGGASAYTLTVTQGALPNGLTLASNGTLSGTPTAAGPFTFTVTATDQYGQTGSRAYGMTIAPTVPGAPVIGTAVEGDTTADVAFTAPPITGGAAILHYTATASPGGMKVDGLSSPIRVPGLVNGTAYTFTVTATNIVGEGAASDASNSVTPKATQTITFTNPGAQTFGTSPTLSASSDSGLSPTFTSSTTSVCTITSAGELNFEKAGTCTISADEPGDGTYLAATTVTQSFTVNAIAPGAPTIGTATAGDMQASVTFSAPSTSGGEVPSLYTVMSNPGGHSATGGSSPITVPGLTNGYSYTFTVTAANSGASGQSPPLPMWLRRRDLSRYPSPILARRTSTRPRL